MVTLAVVMNQLPSQSLLDYSWSVIGQFGFASGKYVVITNGIHDGQRSEGVEDSSGNLIEGSGEHTSISGHAVMFMFPFDPNDPLLYASAWGFNKRTEDDNIGCDEAHGAAASLPTSPSDTTGLCSASGSALCLNDRFAVEVDWRDFDGSSGSGTEMAAGAETGTDTGLFWFFSPENGDLLVRVVNACSYTDTYWVFVSSLTDVELDLTVTDTAAGQTMQYTNPLGQHFEPITDTSAFSTYP